MDRTSLVYLAGAIDNAKEDESINWREWAAEQFQAHGIGAFDPANGFHVDGPMNDDVPGRVVRINRSAVEECDTVLANLTYGRPFQTIREIEFAKAHRKRVVIMADFRSMGMYDLESYRSLVDAVNAIIG